MRIAVIIPVLSSNLPFMPRVSFYSLFPNASRSAIDLLHQMLVLDPDYRYWFQSIEYSLTFHTAALFSYLWRVFQLIRLSNIHASRKFRIESDWNQEMFVYSGIRTSITSSFFSRHWSAAWNIFHFHFIDADFLRNICLLSSDICELCLYDV